MPDPFEDEGKLYLLLIESENDPMKVSILEAIPNKSLKPYRNLIVYELFNFIIVSNILHVLARNYIALAYC